VQPPDRPAGPLSGYPFCLPFLAGEFALVRGGYVLNFERVMPMTSKSSTITKGKGPAVHPGRLLRRELKARALSANRLSLDLGVPSGRITDILNGRRGITADTAVRLGRYFGNSAQFWLDLQCQYDIATVERDRGPEIARQVRPADAA
jgi:antitoxin HigA-1